MGRFKIGIMSDSFRVGLREGLAKAAALGARGVQIYAVSGEMAPEVMVGQKRRDLLAYIQDLGLVVSAICGDLGGHAFADPEDNPARVERSKRIMDLALDLQCNVVTTHIGVVSEDENHPRWAVLAKPCNELATYADSVGAYFAVETGPEPATRLKRFLDSLGARGVRVNLDPANLVMVAGDDPVKAVHTLAPYIVHTHAKDGVMLQKTNPERIYAAFELGGSADLNPADYFLEKPLGEGAVDWPAYLDALEQIGYDGFLTIEREVGQNPEADIGMAVKFLQKMI